MEYVKQEGKTEEETILEICSQKDTIGTWNDVAEILNHLLGYDYGVTNSYK